MIATLREVTYLMVGRANCRESRSVLKFARCVFLETFKKDTVRTYTHENSAGSFLLDLRGCHCSQVIFREGDEGDMCHIILVGACIVTVQPDSILIPGSRERNMQGIKVIHACLPSVLPSIR